MQTQRVGREREREDNFQVIRMGRPVGEEREEENAGLEIQRTWVGRWFRVSYLFFGWLFKIKGCYLFLCKSDGWEVQINEDLGMGSY